MQATSIAAQKSFNASGDKYDHHRKVLAALSFMKSGTFQEIANMSGLTYHQVGRRVSELRDAGKVRDSGTFGLSPSGKAAIKWELVIEQAKTARA